MANTNYNRGVRWERKVKSIYEAKGYTVLRTAGSHGAFDLIAFKADDMEGGYVVRLIQCKVLKKPTKNQAKNMTAKFVSSPPLAKGLHYCQMLEVWDMAAKTHLTGTAN